MNSQIVWIDIPVRDLDRAIAFYGAVFGEEIKRESFPEMTIGLLPQRGTSGCLFVSDGPIHAEGGPLIYLDCSGRLEAAEAAVEPHGGKVLEPMHSIGPFGSRVLILDSEGNRIALHAATANAA